MHQMGGSLQDDFGEATAVVFHKSDRKNVNSFDEVRAGDSIRITDTTTEHFLISIDSIKTTGYTYSFCH